MLTKYYIFLHRKNFTRLYHINQKLKHDKKIILYRSYSIIIDDCL